MAIQDGWTQDKQDWAKTWLKEVNPNDKTWNEDQWGQAGRAYEKESPTAPAQQAVTDDANLQGVINNYRIYISEYNKSAAYLKELSGGEVALPRKEVDAALITSGNIKAMSDIVAQIQEDFKSISSQATEWQTKIDAGKETGVPTYEYDPGEDELMQQVQAEAQRIIDKGEPEFNRPEFNEEYTQKWYDTISRIEAPQEAEALKQVGEYADFANPYARGSGSEIKLANELVQKVIANKNARAMALGEMTYQQDYSKELYDFNRETGERASAFGKLQDISRYIEDAKKFKTDQERSDYWNYKSREWQTGDEARRTREENRRWDRNKDLSLEIAKMMAPQDQSYAERILQPLVTKFLGTVATRGGSSFADLVGLGVNTNTGYDVDPYSDRYKG